MRIEGGHVTEVMCGEIKVIPLRTLNHQGGPVTEVISNELTRVHTKIRKGVVFR